MAGTGNPPAVFVQVIIGCVTAKAGLWHRELRLPVFFCIFLNIFLEFTLLPLETRDNLVYNSPVYVQDANQNERI